MKRYHPFQAPAVKEMTARVIKVGIHGDGLGDPDSVCLQLDDEIEEYYLYLSMSENGWKDLKVGDKVIVKLF
jgi:hypothetical protein